MAKRIIDELQEIYDSSASGVPANQKAQFKAMVKGLTAADLVTYETSVLAASAGLTTGTLFVTTAGALMVVV